MNKKKILIVGIKGFSGTNSDVFVECFGWEDMKKIKNIRDFDVVIINLLSVKKVIDKVNTDILFDHLNTFSLMDIVQNGGKIIIAGDSNFNVVVKKSDSKKIPFLDWTGINFTWDTSPGDTIFFQDDYKHRQYKEYLANFTKWEYSLASYQMNKEIIEGFFNKTLIESKGMEIGLEIDKFCYNRYRNALAFSVRIGIFENKYNKRESIFLYGPIIFLPKINKSEEETIQIILRDVCGVEYNLPEPEWLNEYEAPGQQEIEKKEEVIAANIKNNFEELRKTGEEKLKIRKCLKLLYEREYALEPAVRDILRSLGAHVEDPTEQNKEDGWIVSTIKDKKYEGVLEIKSTKADSFGEDGRKQLLDWIQRGISLREKKYKGIFIGNSAVDKPLKERPWAFSDNWQKSAELNDICAIKTEDLYFLYVLSKQNKLDLDKFWEALFETKGIFDIKPFLIDDEKNSNCIKS
jgi:hypothetical protein